MTTTMIRKLVAEHFYVDFGNPCHQLWASSEEFQQRNIFI